MSRGFRKVVLLTAYITASSLHAQNLIPRYERQIHQSSFTWSLFTANSPVYLEAEAIPWEEVVLMAENSMSKIVTACNFYGQVITAQRLSDDNAEADMKIYFEPSLGICGTTPDWNSILLHQYNWRPTDNGLGGYDLETTILHEMVHAFLGDGHYGGRLMSEECNAQKITSIDGDVEFTLRERYNPIVQFKVKNIF